MKLEALLIVLTPRPIETDPLKLDCS